CMPLRDLRSHPRSNPSRGAFAEGLIDALLTPGIRARFAHAARVSAHGGATSAGLIVSAKLGRLAQAEKAGAAALVPPEAGLNTIDATGFVKVLPDNSVIVMVKHLEMGQGPYTGIATLVAEELDAHWSQMRAQGAPSNAELYKNLAFGIQGTGGSTAIANSY